MGIGAAVVSKEVFCCGSLMVITDCGGCGGGGGEQDFSVTSASVFICTRGGGEELEDGEKRC